MQEFIRRHFWVAMLAVIAGGSFLAAGLFSETIGFVLMGGSPSGDAEAAESVAPPTAAAPVKPRFDSSLVSAASERNIFDAEPEVIEESSFGPEGEGEVPGAGAGLNINVKLLGTLVSPVREWSMATILLDDKSKLVREGLLLNDVVEVSEIHPRYIILRQGENVSVVTLWDVAKPKTSPKDAPMVADAGLVPGNEGESFAAGIQKKGPYDYQIDRNMLEEQLQDLTKLGMQARIVPNYEAGKYAGFRLVGIRPNSLYKSIGLQSGDLLQRINGEEIDTPNKAIQLFESLRNSSQIAIDVVRRGKKVTMNYTIQ